MMMAAQDKDFRSTGQEESMPEDNEQSGHEGLERQKQDQEQVPETRDNEQNHQEDVFARLQTWELEPTDNESNGSKESKDSDLRMQEPEILLPASREEVEGEQARETASPGSGTQTKTGDSVSSQHESEGEWEEVSPENGHIPFQIHRQDGVWIFQESSVRSASQPTDCGAFCYVLDDFPEEAGPALIRVTGEIKYAHVLARKRAEEMGDLGPEEVFHAYATIKKGKQEADVLYHIYPQARLTQSKADCTLPKGCVLIDGPGLLLSLFRKGGKKWQAIAMRWDSSVVLMAGKAGSVVLASRYPLFSESASELDSVMASMDQDLRLVQEEQGVSFSGLQWIEICIQEQLPNLPASEIPLQPWPVYRFQYEETLIWSAVPALLEISDPRYALQGGEEKYLRPLELWEKWLRAALLGGALILAGITWVNWGVAQHLSDQASYKESAVRRLEHKLTSFDYDIYGQEQAEQAVSLIYDLRLAGDAPSLVKIWNAFLHACPSGWKIGTLRFSFHNSIIEAKAEGVVTGDPGQVEQELRLFRQGLKRQGFETADTSLRLKAEEADFSVSVRYPWGKENAK